MNKKRVCLISLNNLYLCPYIKKYDNLIDTEYDVIYWDRHNLDEKMEKARTFPFQQTMEEETDKFSKFIGYLKFRKFAMEIVQKQKYDALILLQTSVGILLKSLLINEYSGKYIIDIRDYTLENNPVFYYLEKKLIENSGLAVISSKGYENFLPPHDYTLVHNDVELEEDLKIKFNKRRRNKDRIVISYIGLIRFHENNKKVILKFKNDERFKLRFIGKGAYTLKHFCINNNVKNVELIDRFPPEKTLDYYYETDVINNLYGNSTPLLDYALSNKLYYAANLEIPILVCPNTFMEEISTKYGFGYTFDINDPKALDNLYNYYMSINWEQFSNNCKRFVNQVNRDNKKFSSKVRKFLEGI